LNKINANKFYIVFGRAVHRSVEVDFEIKPTTDLMTTSLKLHTLLPTVKIRVIDLQGSFVLVVRLIKIASGLVVKTHGGRVTISSGDSLDLAVMFPNLAMIFLDLA